MQLPCQPLNKDLDALKAVAKQWDQQEASQLKNTILPVIIESGEQFSSSQSTIINLFDKAAANTENNKQALTNALHDLLKPVTQINATILTYEKSLKSWRDNLRQAHNQMNTTVGKIQSQEQDLEGKIQAVNATIADLEEQIKNDKKLIAKARKEASKTNVIKTIFGVILGAATGGVGAILAGMGVSSIAEAEGKVKGLEQTINKYQQRLFQQQHAITQEQRELVSLKGLLLPANLALSDVDVAEQSMDDVRNSWEQFHQELTGVIEKINQATDAEMIIVEKAWFNAACKEWALVLEDAKQTANSNA